MVWTPSTLHWVCDDNCNNDLVSPLAKMSSSNGNLNSQSCKTVSESNDDSGRRFVLFGQKMNDKFDFPRTVNSLKSYANEHPVLVVILALMAIMCAIPILAFVCFVVTTLGITFLGFIFVEGTLLTVGTFLLSGVLFFVGFVALVFSACVATTWFVVNKIFSMLACASNKLHTQRKNKHHAINGLYHND